MNKAILVVDNPQKCGDCNMMVCPVSLAVPRCFITGKEIILDSKSYECPLQEVPKKLNANNLIDEAKRNDCFDGFDSEIAWFEGRTIGWNQCVDTISLKKDN